MPPLYIYNCFHSVLHPPSLSSLISHRGNKEEAPAVNFSEHMVEASTSKAEEKGKAVVDVKAGIRPSPFQRLKGLPGEAFEDEPFTIFKLPNSIRQYARDLHEPSMLAIGPYHQKNKHLRAMEAHKWRYLRNFLSRQKGTSWEEMLEKCKGVINALEEQAQRCYVEDFDLSKEEFVEMLLLDGCFIIEYFTKVSTHNWDSMLRLGWSTIETDLIMVENQIPFFVLDALWNLVLEPDCSHDVDRNKSEFRQIVASVLTKGEMKPEHVRDFISNVDFHHLLHLRYTCFMPFPKRWEGQPPASSKKTSRPTIPCATELREVGIRFKQKVVDKEKASSFLDISFDGRGYMEIPQLIVYDDTKPLLMNLVAFEQCHMDQLMFTSYVILMDDLINTEKDVAVLRSCRVLKSHLSSDKELAEFFNQLSKSFAMDPEEFFYDNLVDRVLQYYDSKWPRWRAKLVHDYFSNPWAILSLIAAVILLILTIAQTILAFLAYFRPPS